MSAASPLPGRADPAATFAAMGDATRLALLARLCDGETRSIIRLSQGTGVTRQAVTKHLAVLESAGLVRRTHVGRESRYAFQPESIRQAQSYLEDVSRQWDAALERLRAFVED